MSVKIICHMMGSIDGRLDVDNYSSSVPPMSMSELMQSYDGAADEFATDGIIVGRKTMGEIIREGEARSVVVPAGTDLHKNYFVPHNGQKFLIGFDPHGKLHYGKNARNDRHLIAVLSNAVPASYLAELQDDGISYVFAGDNGHDISRALNAITDAYPIQSLLLEGGGVINGAFMAANLIDEYSIMIYPGVHGRSGSSAIIEYTGNKVDLLTQSFGLKLKVVRRLERDFVQLLYDVVMR